MLSRHMRETHQSRHRRDEEANSRREADRLRRQTAGRSECLSLSPDLAPAMSYQVVVLCPKRRERALRLFSSTRDHLVSRGAVTSRIHRRQGFDRAGGDLQGFEIVTEFIKRRFCPEIQKWFTRDPMLKWAIFCEDDCRLHATVTMQQVLNEAEQAPPGHVVWMGYGLRQGKPKVGAHLVVFPRACMHTFRQELKSRNKTGILSWDTLLAAMWQEGLVVTSEWSLAYQIGHSLKGRY